MYTTVADQITLPSEKNKPVFFIINISIVIQYYRDFGWPHIHIWAKIAIRDKF